MININNDDWITRNQIREFCDSLERKTFYISNSRSKLIGKYFDVNDVLTFKSTKRFITTPINGVVQYKVILKIYNLNKNINIDSTKCINSVMELKDIINSFCIDEL
ncbi:MAG: hypothetical protein AABY22_26650 [Nanoarchaeota archaeon]